MYYFCGKVNRGYVVCSLYGSAVSISESVMGGSTVYKVGSEYQISRVRVSDSISQLHAILSYTYTSW